MIDGTPSEAAGSSEPRSAGGRKVVRWAGTLVLIASVVFLGRRLVADGWNLEALVRGAGLRALLVAGLAYGAICFSLSSAWWLLARWLGQADLGWIAAASVYGRSQIAKYLPGNVFHLAGRQALAMAAGVGTRRAAAATVYEHAGLVGSACVVTLGLLAGVSRGPDARALPPVLAPAVVALALAAMLLLPVAPILWMRLRRVRGTDADHGVNDRLTPPPLGAGHHLRAWLGVYTLHLGFFVAAGGVLVYLAAAFGGPAFGDDAGGAPPWWLAAAFAPAWLAGTVTPGAPSGLGVREAVLLVFLTPALGATVAGTVCVALRLVTTLGDLVFFGSTVFLPLRTVQGRGGS